jgi:hypothetical protein
MLCEFSKFLNVPCNTPPRSLNAGWIALSINSEGSVIKTLYEEISSAVTVGTPWLN